MTDRDHPRDVLVPVDWVRDRLDEFASPSDDYRLVEVNVDPDRYETGHVSGAIELNWNDDLQDESRFDVVPPEGFARLLGEHGIADDTTVVVYGDLYNWFAAYAYWLFTYYGHEDVRLMDGGWKCWRERGYPVTAETPSVTRTAYSVPSRDESIRADRSTVSEAIGGEPTIVDVRAPPEYRGEILAPPGWNENVQRGGHIPGAVNAPWSNAVGEDGRFKPNEALRDEFADVTGDDVIVYCRIGERSAVTWIALRELLGVDSVRHYYGSWVEWGNTVGAPVER